MGTSERRKGREGQAAVKRLLLDRDWDLAGLESGTKNEDILAIDPNGTQWAIEVKNTTCILPTHRVQAIRQAVKRKAKWMLVNHIARSSSWLVQRQGQDPCIWHEKKIK